MTNRLTCFFTLLLLPFSLNAQLRSVAEKAYAFEFSLGPSLVALNGETIRKDIRQPKISYASKIALLFNLKNAISLNAKLLFERKGMRTRYDVWYYNPNIDSTGCSCTTSPGTTENNLNLNYITLAPNLRFHIPQSNFYLEAGPYASYLLKANATRKNSWDGGRIHHYNINTIKRFDAGISLSVGYKVQVTQKLAIMLEATDNFGLLNIKNSGIANLTVTTNALAFLASLQILLT